MHIELPEQTTQSSTHWGTEAICIVLLVAWSAWLSYTLFAFGPDSFVRKHDTAEAHIAHYLALHDLGERGMLGFWHAQAAAGVDALGNAKTDQPIVEALYRFLPRWWNSAAVLLIQSLLATVGLYMLLRRLWGIHPAAALIGGAVFALYNAASPAFSGFAIWHGLFLPALPVWILVLHWAKRRSAPIGALVVIVAGAVVAFGSFAVMNLLLLPVLALWVWAVEGRTTRRTVVLFLLFAAGYLIVEGRSFIALAALAADSHRSLWPDLQPSFADERAYEAVYRDAALVLGRQNVVPLACALAGWCAGGFRRRPLTASLLVCAAILVELFYYGQIRQAIRTIAPALGTIQFDRLGEFLPFFAAVAAGLGLDQLARAAGRIAPARSANTIRLAVLALATVASGAVLLRQSIRMNQEREMLRESGWQYRAIFDRPELAALRAATRGDAPFRVVTFADHNAYSQINGVTWAFGFETADAYINLYPIAYHEFWSRVIAPALERRDDLRDYFDQWGNRIYLFSPYARHVGEAVFESPVHRFSQVANLDLLSLLNVRYIVSAEPLNDARLTRWIAPAGSLPPAGAVPLYIYENPSWLPRAFAADAVESVPTAEQLRDKLAHLPVSSLRRVAYFASGPDVPSIAHSPDPTEATVSFDRYEGDSIQLSVRAAKRSVLVVTNSYSPYWVATVNGSPERVRLTDAAFQGVVVPEGQSIVVLRYSPPWAVRRSTIAAGLLFAFLTGSWVLRKDWLAGSANKELVLLAMGAVLIVAILAIVRPPAASTVGWFDPGWKARQRIDLRGSKLARPAVDVPILIERGAADTSFWETVRANGDDVRFTDAAGAVLPYELERFDPVARRMSAWVRVPVVPVRSDGTIFLYYGNPSAAAGEHHQAVWDSHYLGVWHFTPTQGSSGHRFADSTSHGSDAVPGPTPPVVIEGRIASGVRFGGNGGTLVVPASVSWQLSTEPWSIEFWMKPAAPNKRVLGLLQRGDADLFSLMIHPNGFLYFERRNGDRSANGHYPHAILPNDEWTHIVVRRENGLIAAAFNGQFAPANEEPSSFADVAQPVPLRIGANTYGPFDGVLDELRISQGAPRASEWLRAVYYAQRGELVRFAAEERR